MLESMLVARRMRGLLGDARSFSTVARVAVLDKVFSHPAKATAVVHYPSKAGEDTKIRYSYNDLRAKVSSFSHHMATKGSPAASTRPIASFLPSSVEYCATMLGAWHRNCAFVPLSTQHTPEELSYFLSDTNPQCVVTNSSYEATIFPIAKKLNIPVVNVEDTLMHTQQGAAQVTPQSAEDAALVVYTSGTTGKRFLAISECALHRLAHTVVC